MPLGEPGLGFIYSFRADEGKVFCIEKRNNFHTVLLLSWADADGHGNRSLLRMSDRPDARDHVDLIQ